MLRDPRHDGQALLANLPQREIVSFPKKRALQRETRWNGESERIWGQWRKAIWEQVRRLAEQGEVSDQKPPVECCWRGT